MAKVHLTFKVFVTGHELNDELERIWKEAVVVLSRHFPGGIEENHDKT
jgi:hypothetical protein